MPSAGGVLQQSGVPLDGVTVERPGLRLQPRPVERDPHGRRAEAGEQSEVFVEAGAVERGIEERLRRESHERAAGPQLAGVGAGDQLGLAAELDHVDRAGEAAQLDRPCGVAVTPRGSRSICIVGISTSNGPAASHSRAAMLTAEPM